MSGWAWEYNNYLKNHQCLNTFLNTPPHPSPQKKPSAQKTVRKYSWCLRKLSWLQRLRINSLRIEWCLLYSTRTILALKIELKILWWLTGTRLLHKSVNYRPGIFTGVSSAFWRRLLCRHDGSSWSSSLQLSVPSVPKYRSPKSPENTGGLARFITRSYQLFNVVRNHKILIHRS